jgi:hypothetical protein
MTPEKWLTLWVIFLINTVKFELLVGVVVPPLTISNLYEKLLTKKPVLSRVKYLEKLM